MKRSFIFVFLLFFCIYLHLNPVGKSSWRLTDICELDGYTMISCSRINGTFRGQSGDIVKLYNGWVFELTTSSYNYSFHPQVGVFAKKLDIGGNSMLIYKLFVEDEIYSALRIL